MSQVLTQTEVLGYDLKIKERSGSVAVKKYGIVK